MVKLLIGVAAQLACTLISFVAAWRLDSDVVRLVATLSSMSAACILAAVNVKTAELIAEGDSSCADKQ